MAIWPSSTFPVALIDLCASYSDSDNPRDSQEAFPTRNKLPKKISEKKNFQDFLRFFEFIIHHSHQYGEKQGKIRHLTETLRENLAQKHLEKFWKFFFENFSVKSFQRTSGRFQATHTRACGNHFVKNKRKSRLQMHLKHDITAKIMEKNASYRNHKGKFRTKTSGKILKFFFRKLQC